jgi:hypothetical protein
MPPVAAAPLGWSAFDVQWRAAMALGDPAAVASLTRMPFLFEGRPLDRAGFEHAVPKLFDARLRRCMARAPAVPEPAEPGVRVMSCAPYNFYFDAQGGTWRLREFAVDTP